MWVRRDVLSGSPVLFGRAGQLLGVEGCSAAGREKWVSFDHAALRVVCHICYV